MYKNLMSLSMSLPPDQRRNALSKVLRAGLAEHLSLVISRPLLHCFCMELMDQLDDLTCEKLIDDCIDRIKNRTISYEEQIVKLREKAAHIYEQRGEYRRAAVALAGIPLDSSQRPLTPDFKLQTYLKISEYYLLDGDAVSAEGYVKRGSLLQLSTQDESLQIRYRVALAQVQDHKRKFAEAGQLDSLRRSINATVLAPIGPLRDRMLAALLKDDRVAGPEGKFRKTAQYAFLEKMFRGILIKPESQQFTDFCNGLEPYQQRKLSDGTTIPQRAIQEHNIKCLIQLFSSISFEALGRILGIDGKTAETTVGQMVMENRLPSNRVHVDQVNQMVIFQEMSDRQIWNESIESLLSEINELYHDISQKHPQWTASVQSKKPPAT